MTVNIESLGGLSRRITVTIPEENITSKVNKKLSELAPKLKIAGFRPGKVPIKVIKQRYGDSVRGEVIGDLVKESYSEAIIESKVNPAGFPDIKPVDENANKEGSFSYTASFEIYPEVTVKDFSKIKVELLSAEVTEQDTMKAIDRVISQQASWNDSDQAIESGDRATIDYKVEAGSEVIERESQIDAAIIVGNDIMIKGLEEGLVGLKPGEETQIKITYPKEFSDEELKGKKATYSVKVKKVEKKDQPELTEEFIKSFGVEAGTLDALKEEININLERELNFAKNAYAKKVIFQKLLEAHKFEIPRALVDQECHRLQQQSKQYFSSMQPNAKTPEMPIELFAEEADKNVHMGLLISAIIKEHKLEPDQELVTKRINEIATMYDDVEQARNWIQTNQQQLQNVKGQVLEEQVINLVKESAKLKEKFVGYEELIKSVQGR